MTLEAKEQLLLDLLPFIRHRGAVLARRWGFSIEDTKQDACIAAWQAIDTFDASKGFKIWTWMRHCIDWFVIDIWRKSRSKGRTCPSKVQPILGDAVTDRHADDAKLRRDFDDSIAVCREHEREILTLIFVDGLSRVDVAASRRVSPQYVNATVGRALERLRKRVKP